MKMLKILVTTDFCRGCKQLTSSNRNSELNSLRTALIALANQKTLPKKFRDHQLMSSPYRELHIAGDVLLLYKYETDNKTLTVSLKLSDITDHRKLKKIAHKDDHNYFEVSTEDLHNITSSTNLSDFDEQFLYDLLESIADYASSETDKGYVLLKNYYIENTELHCIYEYISFEDTFLDEIDYVIDLNTYAPDNILQLDSNVFQFSSEVATAFNYL